MKALKVVYLRAKIQGIQSKHVAESLEMNNNDSLLV